MSLFTLSLSLFLLMDSIGNIPIFLSVLGEIDPDRQRKIIFRELIIALIIIIGFFFIGNYLLGILDISQPAVLISGSIILFIIAIRLIFPKHEEQFKVEKGTEPFLVPLAVPLVSGPAVLAAVMLYSHQKINPFIVIGAILIAWVCSTIILLCAIPIKKLLKERGLMAVERFTGLVLIMIAVQMFLNGIKHFFH